MTAHPDQVRAAATVRKDWTGAPATIGNPPAASPERVTGSSPVASVTVHRTIACAAADWGSLERVAPVSPYQTFGWLSAWMATEGAAHGVEPLIGVARDAAGRPVALLPFGVRRQGLVRVVSFLGGRHANYNLGLFDPAFVWTGDAVAGLIDRLVKASGARLDMLALLNQPHEWGGHANPLLALPHQPSPSLGHSTVLVADGEAFLRTHLSAAARKKLRSKAAQLEALGPVSHLVATGPEAIDRVLDAYLAQKAAKLAAIGAGGRPEPAATRAMLVRAARPAAGPPALTLHALVCGERIVATFGALTHGGRRSGLIISHEVEPALARLSPGELLLARVIAAACGEGLASFDLGIGEARYKQGFCPVDDPLFDSFVALTLRGRLAVRGEAARLRLKRRLKQSRWWPLWLRLRKAVAGGRRRR